MQAQLIYCYDAYCGWCYGFGEVMLRVAKAYPQLPIEVLSGGMVIDDTVHHISHTAQYIADNYKRVEALSGVTFGEYYLWHIKHAEESDWIINSEMPAMALSAWKAKQPGTALAFAHSLQHALFNEGRDLDDLETYRHLMREKALPEWAPDGFVEALKTNAFKDSARYEFSLVKQLGINGYPTLLLQVSETKLILLARGFTAFEDVQARIDKVLQELMINS
jgi:putative protein-disulfide isomerase